MFFSNNKDYYKVKEVEPENKGKIEAASVSATSNEILVKRDSGESAIVDYLDDSDNLKKEEQLSLEDKYSAMDQVRPSGKMRATSYLQDSINKRLEVRSYDKHGQSHRGDNLKTMSDSKKEKMHRGEIRDMIK